MKRVGSLLLTFAFCLSLISTGCMCQMGGSSFLSHLGFGVSCSCMANMEMGGMDVVDMEGMTCDGTCCMMEEQGNDNHHPSTTLTERNDINFFYLEAYALETPSTILTFRRDISTYLFKVVQEPIYPIFVPPKIND